MTKLQRTIRPPLHIPAGTRPEEMDRLLTAHQRGEGPLFRRLVWRPAEGAPTVIGVDPGQKGALVLLRDGHQPEIALLPQRTGELDRPVPDEAAIAEVLRTWQAAHPTLEVVMERSQTRTSDTPMTAFGIARGSGALIAIIRLVLGKLPVFVAPGTWQAEMLAGIEDSEVRAQKDLPKDKERQCVRALELWPAAKWPRGPRTGRLLDGAIDGALVGEWHRRQLAGRLRAFTKAAEVVQRGLFEEDQ